MTAAMKFELKNIKHNETMSEETFCYSATLYLDGKKIADVSNHGHGGCDNQYPVKGVDLDAIEARVAATFPKTICEWNDDNGKPHEFEQTIESICSGLVADWLMVKDTKRLMRTKVVMVEGGEMLTLKFKGKIKPSDPRIKEHCEQKYPKATLLNWIADNAELLRQIKSAA